jgi:hypothetical protein
MVVDVNTRRLAKRTAAVGLAWAGLLIVQHNPDKWMEHVRLMVNAAEEEGQR